MYAILERRETEDDFKPKLKKVAGILELHEKGIWHFSPRSSKEVAAIQRISETIYNQFKDHERVVQGEVVWQK